MTIGGCELAEQSRPPTYNGAAIVRSTTNVHVPTSRTHNSNLTWWSSARATPAARRRLAAARAGARVLVVTPNLDRVGFMPCNPSIGGAGQEPHRGRSRRARRRNGRGSRPTAVQVRRLNTSKGPAVQAVRHQIDKALYSLAMKQRSKSSQALDLFRTKRSGSNFGRSPYARSDALSAASFAAVRWSLPPGTFLRGCHDLGRESPDRRARRRCGRPTLGGQSAGTRRRYPSIQDRHSAADRRPHGRFDPAGTASRGRLSRAGCPGRGGSAISTLSRCLRSRCTGERHDGRMETAALLLPDHPRIPRCTN